MAGGRKNRSRSSRTPSKSELSRQSSDADVAQQAAPTTPVDSTPAPAQPTPASEPETSAPAASSEDAPAEVDALRAQNAALQEQVASLQAALVAKDAELAQLRVQVAGGAGGGLDGGAVITANGGVDGLTSLQERLAKLKAEQAQADAARDNAWADLKRCVGEIARLANPVSESPRYDALVDTGAVAQGASA